ncbi:hypothetical protein FISHEDRAFT_50723 [Fistulina hepatica ATCC 64428]|uniref:Uncharacterized protein n=1 Tax=Fistulina hepatica ATCC 64428 TaxID=1128425 RepID=A0A0D7A1Q9_9AGAR|nr:hypothetical protein FISHEDRAFT_50723 [Fistulina hepatica ATCC 64428]
MGKSAKMCKRVPKKTTSSMSNQDSTPSSVAETPVQRAAKKAALRSKAVSTGGKREGHVLGGADYIDIMMGSRKRAREEAQKLPSPE